VVRGGGPHGRAVQLDPIKATLKLPGTKLLIRKCDKLLSNVAFNFKLRRYSMVHMWDPREGMTTGATTSLASHTVRR